MVTVWLCAVPSVVANDQLHVPDAFVPAFVTVPTEALSVTVSPALASDQVPVLEAVWPSLTVIVASLRLITGGVLAAAFRVMSWALFGCPPGKNRPEFPCKRQLSRDQSAWLPLWRSYQLPLQAKRPVMRNSYPEPVCSSKRQHQGRTTGPEMESCR